MNDAVGRAVIRILLSSLAVTATGCQVASNLVPRTLARSVSPDGRHTASVWRASSIDPPDDHLFLATGDRPARPLMDLAIDADWSRTIIWTSDSRKVGFVIADDRLAVFDVESARLEAFFFLAGTGCCGGPQESRNVAFSADGTSVSFDRFERPTVLLRNRNGEPFEAHLVSESEAGRPLSSWQLLRPEKHLGREVVRIPGSHIRLRLNGARPELPQRVHVRVVFADQRVIEVTATPRSDGLFVLPAVDDGPIDRLEVGLPGGGGNRTIVRGVKADNDETTVNVARSAT